MRKRVLIVGSIVAAIVLVSMLLIPRTSKSEFFKVEGFDYFNERVNVYTVRDDFIIEKSMPVYVEGTSQALDNDKLASILNNNVCFMSKDEDKYFIKIEEESNKDSEELAPAKVEDKKSKFCSISKTEKGFSIKLPGFTMKHKYISFSKDYKTFKISDSKEKNMISYELKVSGVIDIESKEDLFPRLVPALDAIHFEISE